MEKQFFKAIEACLRDRLGEIYVNDSEYQESLKNEDVAYAQLKEELTESQLDLVNRYRDCVYATQGVCEILSYRQGMRDMAEITGVKGKVG